MRPPSITEEDFRWSEGCGVAEQHRGNRWHPVASKDVQTKGRLRARPAKVKGAAPVDLQRLMLGAARDSYLCVPAAPGLLLLAPDSREHTWDPLVGRRYGHDHIYERTVPIRSVTYVVSGGRGRSLYPAARSARTVS